MTTNKPSSAIIPYEQFIEEMTEANDKFNSALASMILTLPIRMTYEFWWELHTIKGDI